MEKHEFYFMNYIFASKIVFKHVLFSAQLIYIQNNFSVLKGKWTSVQCTHQPCMELFFFWRGSPVDNFALPHPGVGGGAGGGYVPRLSLVLLPPD